MGVGWDSEDFERRLNELIEKAPDGHSTALQREVQALTCPTHGKHPQVTVKGTGKKAEFRVGGFCCDEFADTVNAYLSSVSERSRRNS
jgi:hypothetical protein